MASRFTRKGVQVYAIGIGRAYRGELKSIAYKNKHVYYMKTFGSLVARANQIASAICNQQVTVVIDVHFFLFCSSAVFFNKKILEMLFTKIVAFK